MHHFWGTLVKNNKIINSIDLHSDNGSFSEDAMKNIVSEFADKFDISNPVWLPKHFDEFKSFKRITFYKDDFIDDVNFDKFEIEFFNKDKKKKKGEY